MVDIITDNIKPQIDATGGGKKMSLQDDYDMCKDTGVFVYEENKNRYLKEKNINATMPAVNSEDQTEEVKVNKEEAIPLPK